MAIVGEFSKNKTKTVFINTASQLITRLISTGASFLVTLFIARSYGLELYGDFTKITTYITLFYLLSDFGMNAIYLQQDRDQDKNNESWRRLFGTRLFLSTLFLFLSITILVFLPGTSLRGYTPYVKVGIILYSISIIFQGIIASANALFQKKLRYELSTLAITAGSIVSILLVFMGVHIFLPRVGLQYSVLSLIFGTFVSSALALIIIKKLCQNNMPIFSLNSSLALLQKSAPLALTLLFNLIYFRIDTFVLTVYRSTADVGIYGMAYKVFEFALVIPTFFMNSMYPILLKIINNNNSMSTEASYKQPEFIRLIKKSGITLLLLSLVITLIYIVFAPQIALISRQFFDSIVVLRILSVSLPLFFLSSLGMWILVAMRKQKILAAIYFVGMTVNILLNMIYVPKFGYIAAAVITGATEALVLIMSIIVISKELLKSGRKES